ncbi:MAG: ABC transporter ATP-binding protein [Candidatus Rokubacteria bacterium]|nr:ABC transporter ATP-binding protein [Candidatus Rokubacteria bacterium]
MPALCFERLTKVYGSGDTAVVGIQDAAMSVERGELVAIIGPSGSGKSTLLAAIGLIVEPSSGRLEIDGDLVYDDRWVGPDPKLIRRRKIGFIFQHHNLIPFLTVAENVQVALDINGVRGRRAAAKVKELLAYLQIDHRAQSYPGRISGGERQRVAIARALANEPLLILADEPTASLDTERGMSVMDHLRRLAHERDAAVITVTHDERMIAGFDRIGRVQDGRLLVAHAELANLPGDPGPRSISCPTTPFAVRGESTWKSKSGVPI